jgi:hypothetical protein
MYIAPSPKKSASWVLILFGLPFLGIGLGVLIWSGKMWMLYDRSASWNKVPATIVSADFEVHHGDKSTSYSVKSRYNYTVNGQAYQGDRVGVEGGGGSSDSYHSRRYDILVKHRDSKTPFEALVNPADPHEALLFRERSTTLYALPLFGLVFALAGLAVSSSGIYTSIKAKLARSRLDANPGRPWRANRRWQTFQVHDSPGRKIAGSLAMAIFTGIFMSIFVIALHGDNHAPLFAKIIVGLLTLIPIGGLISAIYHTLRYIKYGNAALVFRQIPFILGQNNSAILYVREHIAAEKGTELTLQCLRKEWVKNGNKSSLEEREIYSEKKTVETDLANRSGRGSAIPVQFIIPENQPETFTAELPNFIWRLTAKAATPGVDFSAQFNIPVYTVTDTSLIDRNPLAGTR